MKPFLSGLIIHAMAAASFAAAPERPPEAQTLAAEKLHSTYRAELDLIVVTKDVLPEGSRLAPMDKGSKFLPGNPTVSQDPQVMMMVSMIIGTMAVTDQSITNDIECAFSAVYHDDDGKETGVNLLLFKEAEKAEAIFQALEAKAYFPLIHHDRYLMCIWTDNQNKKLANWMKAHFENAEFPKQETTPSCIKSTDER